MSLPEEHRDRLPEDLRARGLRIGTWLSFSGSDDPLADQLFAKREWLEFDPAGELALEFAAPMKLHTAVLVLFRSLSDAGSQALDLLDYDWDVRAADGEQRFPIEVRPASWELLRTALEQRR